MGADGGTQQVVVPRPVAAAVRLAVPAGRLMKWTAPRRLHQLREGLHDPVKSDLGEGYAGLFGNTPFAMMGRPIGTTERLSEWLKTLASAINSGKLKPALVARTLFFLRGPPEVEKSRASGGRDESDRTQCYFIRSGALLPRWSRAAPRRRRRRLRPRTCPRPASGASSTRRRRRAEPRLALARRPRSLRWTPPLPAALSWVTQLRKPRSSRLRRRPRRTRSPRSLPWRCRPRRMRSPRSLPWRRHSRRPRNPRRSPQRSPRRSPRRSPQSSPRSPQFHRRSRRPRTRRPRPPATRREKWYLGGRCTSFL